jgi:hypothetical protein
MSFLTSRPHLENLPALPVDRPVVYLVLAALALLVALRFAKRALAPMGAILEAVVAAAVVSFAIVAALAFIGAAALSAH